MWFLSPSLSYKIAAQRPGLCTEALPAARVLAVLSLLSLPAETDHHCDTSVVLDVLGEETLRTDLQVPC